MNNTRPLEKLWGWEREIFDLREFFSLSNSFYELFFLLIFPCANIFFLYLALPPHKFSKGPPLTIVHLHDGVILLLRPESFGFFLSCANYRLCYLNLAGITKFKCERKNERILVVVSKNDAIVQMAYSY